MTEANERLQQTLEAIDSANQQDPNTELYEGKAQPKELLYGQRMSQELAGFCPEASEHLQLAARAQHIERWKSARSDYPEGRSGYKKWRAELSLFHAQRVGEIMAENGYSEDDISKVRYLVQKRQLKRNPETQTLEDVICLVFLRYYFEDFAAKHTEEKLIDIVRKTWNKMSDNGHKSALEIKFPENITNLLEKSLSE